MLALATLTSLALPLLAAAAPARRDTSANQKVLAMPSGLETQAIHLAVASGCPKGFSAGSVSHSVTIPTTLVDVAAGLSFYNPPNAAYLNVFGGSGLDNAAGSTRSLTVDPRELGLNTTVTSVQLEERIETVDDFEPWFLDRVWSSSAPAVVDGSISIPSHSSHLVLTPACRNKASTLMLTTSFCASDAAFAEGLFRELQVKTAEGLEGLYGRFYTCADVRN